MSSATKKSPSGAPGGRRSSTDPALSPPSTSTASSTTPSAVTRTRSIRGGMLARGALQRSGAGASSLSSNSVTLEGEDDARGEYSALVDDLKERLRKSEEISHTYEQQVQILRSRLDEAIHEQGRLEEKLHEDQERVETLVNDKRDAFKQRREIESLYEVERSCITTEREEMAIREKNMQMVIQKLKDSLSQKSGSEGDRVSRRSGKSSPNLDNGQFAPPPGLARSDSRSSFKLLVQKDKLIESLRLEVAESRTRLLEAGSGDGGRLQQAERSLMETRMTNARLMEDNESYQLLLRERTLNGDFGKEIGYRDSSTNADALNALEGRAPTSLADELSQSEEDATDISAESQKSLVSELKAAKDSNKALTLYINKIIERLLQHQDFEAILDQSSDFKPTPAAGGAASNIEKDLPPPPAKEQASGRSILQRAKTVAMGGATAARKARPQSQVPCPIGPYSDSVHGIPPDPGRPTLATQGRVRPLSEQFNGAANVINQMYKGGPTSPPSHGPQTSRYPQSFFSPGPVGGDTNAKARRAPSASQVASRSDFAGTGSGAKSESDSVNEDSGDVITPPQAQSPRPSGGSEREKCDKKEGMASFSGGKPRPLRLVRDREAKEKEDNKAKRGSWMGWAWGGGAARKEDGELIQE